ncbi:MAG: hypothetical protein F4Y45_13815 [Acidobacteria bacterium]|nr:hypothetical protein [Acidobacteriota bacterium]MYJ06134.1 hypothetical protein [Acidobacteriota bacterium]
MSGQKPWTVVVAVLGILASLGVLVGIGYAAWYADGLIVRPPDYCPTGSYPQVREGIEVPGHTAILIDTSDEISATDAGLAFEKIVGWTRDTAPWLQRLSIHGLPESAGDRVARRHGTWCVPKRGADANMIYENPVYVEAQFQRFLATLQDMFRELVRREEAAQSPIVETIANLIEDHEDLDSVLLVSDMLQNTSLWNHYTKQGDTPGIRSECQRITSSGRLKTVYVYYIDRKRPGVQAAEWPDPWWSHCLGTVQTEMLN